MEKSLVSKTCSFYVSKYHLVTMLLPYIGERLSKGIVVKTMFEESFEENITKLISNVGLEDCQKNSIMNIKWDAFKMYKYQEIEEELSNINAPLNIIISGRLEYIDMMNKNIEKWLERYDVKFPVTINNCFDVLEVDNKQVDKIIASYEKILNTCGEQYINDVFGKNDSDIVNN